MFSRQEEKEEAIKASIELATRQLLLYVCCKMAKLNVSVSSRAFQLVQVKKKTTILSHISYHWYTVDGLQFYTHLRPVQQ